MFISPHARFVVDQDANGSARREVVAAAEEERFSRHKHDHRFPARAIAFCLRRAGIAAHQVDAVAFYEQPVLKFDRIVRSGLKARTQGRNRDYLTRVLDGWVHERKFDSRRRICDHFGIAPERVYGMTHHAAHASAVFFCSPFDRATVVTMDGVGEYETVTVSEAHDRDHATVWLVLPTRSGCSTAPRRSWGSGQRRRYVMGRQGSASRRISTQCVRWAIHLMGCL